MTLSLKELGYCAFFETQLQENETLARVTEEQKKIYRVQTEKGELIGECTGKFVHATTARERVLPALTATRDGAFPGFANGTTRKSLNKRQETKPHRLRAPGPE